MTTPNSQIIAEVATAAATPIIDHELTGVKIVSQYRYNPTLTGPEIRKTVLQAEFERHLVVLVRLEHATGVVEWGRPDKVARYPQPAHHMRQALAAEERRRKAA